MAYDPSAYSDFSTAALAPKPTRSRPATAPASRQRRVDARITAAQEKQFWPALFRARDKRTVLRQDPRPRRARPPRPVSASDPPPGPATTATHQLLHQQPFFVHAKTFDQWVQEKAHQKTTKTKKKKRRAEGSAQSSKRNGENATNNNASSSSSVAFKKWLSRDRARRRAATRRRKSEEAAKRRELEAKARRRAELHATHVALQAKEDAERRRLRAVGRAALQSARQEQRAKAAREKEEHAARVKEAYDKWLSDKNAEMRMVRLVERTAEARRGKGGRYQAPHKSEAAAYATVDLETAQDFDFLMAEAQRAPPPSPVPLLSYGKPFSSSARKGWSRYAVERPRGIGGRAAGAQRRGGSGSIDDKDDEDFNIEEADSDERTGSMTMTQSDHVAGLKTSEFIAERVSELDRSLRDLIVDSDERPET